MNILPQLNLNKYPRTCIANSLVDCRNMMFDIEKGVMSNENKLEQDNSVNYDVIVHFINNSNYDGLLEDYEIIGSINCAKEIVYFIKYKLKDIDKWYLCLYRSPSDKVYLHKQQVEYIEGAKVIGNHTYNYNNELIIVFSQYVETDDKYFPLSTINLDDSNEESYKLPLVPEVIIPNIKDYHYISKANWYKGQNYFFIRYKINDYDYTQWYDLHKNIYCDDWKRNPIINVYDEHGRRPAEDDEIINDGPAQYDYDYGEWFMEDDKYKNFSRYLYSSDDKDIINRGISIELDNLDIRYSEYQIGILIVKKDNNKAFISNDIKITNTKIYITATEFHEGSSSELITEYYNIYNVKEVVNFKNKLHISNYLERKEKVNFNLEAEVILGGYYNRDGNTFTLEPVSIGDMYAVRFKSTLGSTFYGLYYGDLSNYNINSSDYIYLEFLLGGATRGLIGKYINNISSAYDIIRDYADGKYTKVGRMVKFNNGVDLTKLNKYGQYYYKYKNSSVISSFSTSMLDTNSINIIICRNHRFYKLGNHDDLVDLGRYLGVIPVSGNDIDTIILDAQDFSYDNENILPNDLGNVFNEEPDEYREEDYRKIRCLIPGEYYSFYIHFVDKYGISTDGFNIAVDNAFTNRNGDYIVKIPDDINSYKLDVSQESIPLYYLKVTLDSIPEGYIGWFISYENFEKSSIYKMINIYDAIEVVIDEGENDDVINIPFESNGMYSTKLNYDDKINLNINKYYKYNGSFDVNRLTLYPNNSQDNILFNTKIVVNGIGDLVNNIWVNLYNEIDDEDRYISKNKLLIPLSKVFYDDGEYELINENYNGVLTILDAIVYKRRIAYDNSINKWIEVKTGKQELNSEEDGYTNRTELLLYDLEHSIKVYSRMFVDDFYNESKCFNNPPQVLISVLYDSDDYEDKKHPKYFAGVWTDVKDLIDLYKMPQYNINENYPKVLLNFDEKLNKQITFDKTIKRSNAMADESLENSWRKFDVEQYINIRENKGKIVNIFSIGNAFYVHTEHSLFQFDYNDRLTSNGDVVEVSQKDIFDTRYNELFNSDLGFGGLQDRNAYCVGDFGYMWYNTDFKRFFILSKEGPKDISATINGWLSKVNITNVQFGDDKDRKRLLIMFNDANNIHCLSYNYAVPGFVSIHDLTDIYNEGDNRFFAYTKKDLFIIDNSGKHIFKFNNNEYVSVFNLAIINNVNFDDIKFIEYIQYIMAEIQSNSDNVVDIDYWSTPVKGNDGILTPYSGDKLVISSEETITDIIDLKTTDETNKQHITINKPYYELGRWNFNKVIDKRGNRMFGKYIVSNFKFNRDNNNKVEFESINVALTKYRK